MDSKLSRYSDPDIINVLISAGADIRPYHILLSAATLGYASSVILLIKAGAEVNPNLDCDTSALDNAVYENHIAIVKILLDAGARTYHPCTETTTILLFVLYKKDLTLLQLLYDKTPERFRQGLLFSAIFYRATEIVRYLVEKGNDVNERHASGETPLIEAIRTGVFEIVKILIEAGADLKQRNRNGASPLSTAIALGHKEIAKWIRRCIST